MKKNFIFNEFKHDKNASGSLASARKFIKNFFFATLL